MPRFPKAIAALLLLPPAALAARPPSPEQARAAVQDLEELVLRGSLGERELYRIFTRPQGPAPAVQRLFEQDRLRLLAALAPDGPLGRFLLREPPVAATVLGPDYARVVLGESPPYLSFVAVRRRGQAALLRWGPTRCADCSEPERFVRDLLGEVAEGANRLVPGLDLEPPQFPGEDASRDWRMAFQHRNLTAGYLRFLLDGARLLEVEQRAPDEALARLELRGREDSWPLRYEEGAWKLVYEGLPPGSALRLDPSEARRWRDDELLRERARDWWTPLHRPLPGGGELWATGAVGLGYDPVGDRWLVALERPDGRVAHLVGLDAEGVSLRRSLPHWPERHVARVPGWPEEWVVEVSPDGRRLFLAGAGRAWIVELDGQQRSLEGGAWGHLQVASWSAGQAWLALGDRDGRLALVDAATGQLRARYLEAEGSPLLGLAFGASDGELLAAWENGRLSRFSVPGLDELDRLEGLCCGELRGMAPLPLAGEVLAACGGGCPPLVLERVAVDGLERVERVADPALFGLPRLVPSPDGRLLALAHLGPGGALAICRSSDLAVLQVVGESEPLDLAWNRDGSALLALYPDGSVAWWPIRREP